MEGAAGTGETIADRSATPPDIGPSLGRASLGDQAAVQPRGLLAPEGPVVATRSGEPAPSGPADQMPGSLGPPVSVGAGGGNASADGVQPTLATGLATRIAAAVEEMRLSTPPQSMIVEVPGPAGARISVALRGDAVHVTLLGPAADQVSTWLPDVAVAMARQGLTMTGHESGRRRQGADSDQPATRPRTRSQRPAGDRAAGTGIRL